MTKMPRDITVTFQDGRQHVYKNAPDDLTPEQVTARAEKEFSAKVASLDGGRRPQQDTVTKENRIDVGRQLKSLGSSAIQGLLDLPDLLERGARGYAQIPSELAGALLGTDKTFNPEEEVMRGFQAPSETGKLIEAVDVPSESRGETYAKAGVRGLTGSVGPGVVRAPLLTLGTGASSGVSAEAAAQLTSDNALSRLIGGMIGGQVGGRGIDASARRLAPNTQELAREAIEGLSPADLEKAKKVMALIKEKYGIELDLSQALNEPKNMTALRDVLANSRYGDEVQRILRDQPTKVIGLSNTEVDELPGTVLPSMQQSANTAQDAATKVLQNLRDTRRNITAPMYEKAGALKGTTEALTSTIEEMVKQPLSTEVRRDLLKFRSKLLATPWSQGREKASTFDEIDTLFKEFTGPYAPRVLNGKNPITKAEFDKVAGELRGLFYEGSEGAKKAAGVYRDFTEANINPVKKSPIGRLATPREAQPDREAAVATLQGIFDRGTDPKASGTSEILTLAKSFKQIDPSVFNDAAKTWLSGKLANLVKFNEDGVVDPSSMKDIKENLFTTPAQRQGMRDVLAGMADNANLPRARVVGAFEGFMNVLSKTAKRPATTGGLPQQEIAKMAGKSKLADAVRFWGFTANMTAGRRIEEHVLGKTMRQLDKMLTTEQGVEYLQALAQDGYVSPRAIILGASALSSINAAENSGENNSESTEP